MNHTLRTLILCIGFLSIVLTSCKKTEYPDAVVTPPNITDSVSNLYLDITSDTILTNKNNGTDYRFANFIHVRNGATLTIKAGVTIEVTQNAGIEISDGAALKIEGTSTQKVLITGQTKTIGFWKGLYFKQTSNPNNQLKNCTIEYAGSDSSSLNVRSAINVYGSAIQLDSCTLKNNRFFALYIDTAVTSFSMHNCTLTGNLAQPVLMYHTNCDFLTGDNAYTGNFDDKVLIKSVVLTNCMRNQTFKKLPIPYSIDGTARFAQKLTFEHGVRFVMQKLSYIYMDNSVNGLAQIEANGIAGDSVIFSGLKADSGQWQGIGFYSGGNGLFNYCRLSDSGAGSTFNNSPNGILTMSGPGTGNLNVTHCKIKLSIFNGIVIKVPEVTYNSDIETINSFQYINDTNVVYY